MAGSNWQQALDRTRRAAMGRLAQALGTSEINDQTWEGIESGLMQADVGAAISAEIVRTLRTEAASQGLTRNDQLRAALRAYLVRQFAASGDTPLLAARPLVYVLVGVNGSGKTTSAAKLAAFFRHQGRSVLLAAADTYRAAADEQLQLWAKRLEVDVISGKTGSDPAAVAFEAAQAALSRQIDFLLVDTSGRMHTSHNLMAELQKVCRVTGKVIPGAPHRVILVLDATTGQNALAQARAFTQAVGVTEILLTKLDGSAKGGIALAIHRRLGLPLTFVGLGEGPDDLAPFDAEAYVEALLPNS